MNLEFLRDEPRYRTDLSVPVYHSSGAVARARVLPQQPVTVDSTDITVDDTDVTVDRT